MLYKLIRLENLKHPWNNIPWKHETKLCTDKCDLDCGKINKDDRWMISDLL